MRHPNSAERPMTLLADRAVFADTANFLIQSSTQYCRCTTTTTPCAAAGLLFASVLLRHESKLRTPCSHCLYLCNLVSSLALVDFKFDLFKEVPHRGKSLDLRQPVGLIIVHGTVRFK